MMSSDSTVNKRIAYVEAKIEKQEQVIAATKAIPRGSGPEGERKKFGHSWCAGPGQGTGLRYNRPRGRLVSTRSVEHTAGWDERLITAEYSDLALFC